MYDHETPWMRRPSPCWAAGPDIIIIIIICMLIEVAIPGDRNVIKKEAENIFKYKDLTI
jgi:hypothetical protein